MANKVGPKDLHDQKFYLLHLSLLREYLSLEFQEIENQLNFEYDFDRILDDFILIMYVIGNDFCQIYLICLSIREHSHC